MLQLFAMRLPPAVRQAVYRRMLDRLSASDARTEHARRAADDRQALLEILRETMNNLPDFFRR